MQELGKSNPKISVIPNGSEKYLSFTVNNKLSFIGSFQFLSSSLDNFVKNLNKHGFKYLNQELDKKKLDLDKQKGFYPSEFLNDFEVFKKITSKEKTYCS